MQISAGASHACGVTGDGAAWCWGDNQSGQLGLGSDFDELEFIPVPTRVNMPSGVAVDQIAAGNGFTCALTTGDDIYCWGDDTYGQLGDGTEVEEPPFESSPVLVVDPTAGAVNWAQVSAGNAHVCARTTANAVYCWGTNASWQLGLGDGFDDDFHIPMPIDTSGGIPDTYTGVSAGSVHSCAIATGGTAWCWGGNLGGELGTGTVITQATSPIAVDMSSIAVSGFTNIAAGGYFTCALEGDGDAWCWGAEDSGELGNGGDASDTVYAPVAVVMPSSVDFEQIDIDYVNACARSTTDVVYCWGDDSLGGVGNTSNDGSETQWFTVPVAIATAGALPDTYASMDTGDGFACGVTAAGEAWCWGTDDYGQLGIGDWNQSSETAPTRVADRGSLIPSDIAIGDGVACALDVIGRAWCWGANGMGQIGDGTRTDRLLPTAVTMPVHAGEPVVFGEIQMGGSHVCALDLDGAAWCWGENGRGQLGDGTTTDRLVPTRVDMPTYLGAEVTFFVLSLGAEHTCAMSYEDGYNTQTWCWGEGSNGEIGDGNTSDRSTPTEVTLPSVNGTPITGFTDITVGGSHTCATSIYYGISGLIWCWGDNASGQLGDGTTIDRSVPTEIIRPLVDSQPVEMVNPVAGGAHTCARSPDSTTLWCWGRGTSGQLGNGATGNSSLPVQVALPGSVTSFMDVAVGADFGCVLAYGDIYVYCWGEGSLGQIGNGFAGDVSTPTLVSLSGDSAWYGVNPPALSGGPGNMCILSFAYSPGVTIIGKAVCWGKASLWVYSSSTAVSTPTRLVPGTAPSGISSLGHLSLSLVGLLALGAITRTAGGRRTRRRRVTRVADDAANDRGDV